MSLNKIKNNKTIILNFYKTIIKISITNNCNNKKCRTKNRQF